MTNQEDLQAELQTKIKAGVKPSDLKKSRSTPTPSRSFQQDQYLQELESEKADLLAQLANYEKEQKASVKVYRDQERLIAAKEQQLVQKDEQLTEQQEQITKLKVRLHQLAQEKKELQQLAKNPAQIPNPHQPTSQTTSTKESEEQELAKRLELLSQAPLPPNTNFPSKKTEREKNLLIIFLLILLASTLLFK